jgi:magnesium-transporting ATPase (P-type)
MIESTLCFVGFLSIFILAGHTHRIGLPFFAPLANLVNFRLNLSFEETILLAATVYHLGVVMSQVGNALACRSDRTRSSSLGWLSNKYLLVGILMELLGVAALIYVPFLAKIFNHAALPAWLWLGLSLNAFVLYSVEWLRKAIVRGFRKMRNGKTSTLALQEVSR